MFSEELKIDQAIFRISVVRCTEGTVSTQQERLLEGHSAVIDYHRFRCLRSPNQLVDLDPDFVVLFDAFCLGFKPEIPIRSHESHVLRLNGVFFSLQGK